MKRSPGRGALLAPLGASVVGRGAGGNRILALALVASVGLHAAVFAALHAPSMSAQREAGSAPLAVFLETVRVAPAPALQRAPVVVPERDESKRMVEKRRITELAVARARPVQHEAARRSHWKSPAEAEPTAPQRTNPAVAHAAARAPGLPQVRQEAESDSSASRVAASASEQAAALAQYRVALIAGAQRYREYPRLALDNDWRGKVDVRMAVAASGALASLSVGSGSGYEVLDRQALEMIRKAKPVTPIPAALRGRDFILDIPVIFELREPSA